MSEENVPLGPFVLERPIGRGGMAEVWLGAHRAQNQRVAVKILTGERAREEAFIRALKNEIHNVARLHHPGIILLFDTGEVDAAAERASGGRFVAGSPWFAMELASHGALSPRRLPLPWATTRMLLLSLLDALAHAHARGVIHRDLKPGNILLCAPDDPRPGLKITDFGIAQPLGEHVDGEAEQGRLSGTPRYMAPEQFQAKWRDFGPWTDLYALGCIAYQLATGKAPFAGDALKLAIAHCHDAPETPSMHMPKPVRGGYPDGYDAWVLRLLEKDPQRRFACAADAAWALLPMAAGPGVADDVTVVAGWEQALRSLKPQAIDPSDASGAATVLRTSLTGEVVEGSAQQQAPPSQEASHDDEQEMSQSAISAAIKRTEITAVNTLVDRPSALDRKRVESQLTDAAPVKPNVNLASASSEMDSTGDASLPPELRSDDDSLFPRIAPEAPRGKKGTKIAAPPLTTTQGTGSGPRVEAPLPPEVDVEHSVSGPWPAGAPRSSPSSPPRDPKELVDTTFAPNAPWTELAALAPQDALPTSTGRAQELSTANQRRRAHKQDVDESRLAPRLPPPMPPTWRRAGAQAPSRHLLGAGLGLYGLRQIPLVDRDHERDLVWDMLRAVHDGTGARIVVIRGPAGIGKTRLAEWLVERAAEVGAAVALRSGHGPGGGPLDGLAGLVAIHARTVGLERRALQRRLIEVCRRQGVAGVEEALALAELLEPARDDLKARRARGRHPKPSLPPQPASPAPAPPLPASLLPSSSSSSSPSSLPASSSRAPSSRKAKAAASTSSTSSKAQKPAKAPPSSEESSVFTRARPAPRPSPPTITSATIALPGLLPPSVTLPPMARIPGFDHGIPKTGGLEDTGDRTGDRDPTGDVVMAAGGPDLSDESERVRLDSARERHAVCLRYLVRAAKERPVVAWLDDVQWGGDAIAFAKGILDDDRGRMSPVLLILSASEEELGDRPVEAAALDELCQNARVTQMQLPHLPEKDHRALVEELLGLEQGLAVAVAGRTAGNPLFAVQLVGDFVHRGVLELTPHGFALRKGERAALPDDLHEVWRERIARVCDRAGSSLRVAALELGSVLGTSGDDGEWQAICDEAGVDLPPDLVDDLLAARLVVNDDGGLRFAHAMLRESVLREAAEAGRLEGHHRVAARMLQKRYGDRRRGMAERIGRHLVSAGETVAALPYLLRAAEEAASSSGFAQAHMILAERDAAIDALGLPEDDVRRAEGWSLKASFLTDEGRLDEARMWSGLVLRFRDSRAHAAVVASALRVRGQCALQQAQWDEATTSFTDGRSFAQSGGDLEMTVRCTVGLADTAYYRGRLDESAELLNQALSMCQDQGDEAGMAYCLWNLAYVSIWRGDTDEARELLLRQQKLARRTGHRSMIANGKNALGDLERFSGHYDDAEARYDDALRLLEAIGSGKRRTVRLNMAMNALARGNFTRARALANELLNATPRIDPGIASLCHGVLAGVCAHDREWDEYDDHFDLLARSKSERDLVDADGAMLFEIIGDHARAQEDEMRAASAYENAHELWTSLGRRDRAEGVQSALAKIGTVPQMKRRRRDD